MSETSRARALWLNARHALKRRLRPPRSSPEVCDAGTPPVYTEPAWLGDKESPDQRYMDAALVGLAGPSSRILHVGVGSSAIARRWAAEVAALDGVTVVPEEAEHAARLGLPNYRVFVADKYHGLPVSGPYDLILDNNLSSFACCMLHYREMFARYADLLAAGGQLLTERRGMDYAAPGGFALTMADLRAICERHDLQVSERGSVVLMRRGA